MLYHGAVSSFVSINSFPIFYSDDMKMETDIKRNKKTLLDQHGQYPIWMNQRLVLNSQLSKDFFVLRMK